MRELAGRWGELPGGGNLWSTAISRAGGNPPLQASQACPSRQHSSEPGFWMRHSRALQFLIRLSTMQGPKGGLDHLRGSGRPRRVELEDYQNNLQTMFSRPSREASEPVSVALQPRVGRRDSHSAQGLALGSYLRPLSLSQKTGFQSFGVRRGEFGRLRAMRPSRRDAPHARQWSLCRGDC